MNLSRRAALGALLALPAGRVLAQAAAWPSRSISIIVPFTPGGAGDGVTRAVAQKAAAALGASLVIENRPGGGTLVGSEVAARAAPDGYTLLMISSALPSTLALRRTASLKLEQFTPVTVMAEAPLALVVRPSLPVRSVQELVTYAKAQPNKLTAATNGVGTTTHLMAAKLGIDAGFGVTDVPYPGSAQAWQDLIGGRIDMYFDAMQNVLPHVQAGHARLLATTAAQRGSASPDTPTMKEAGFPALVNSPWWGIAVPAGTPEAIVRRLEKVLVDAGQAPDVRSKLVAFGANPVFNDRTEAAAFLKRDLAFWTSIVETANIRIQQ